jgi:hypothetical protein
MKLALWKPGASNAIAVVVSWERGPVNPINAKLLMSEEIIRHLT